MHNNIVRCRKLLKNKRLSFNDKYKKMFKSLYHTNESTFILGWISLTIERMTIEKPS